MPVAEFLTANFDRELDTELKQHKIFIEQHKKTC